MALLPSETTPETDAAAAAEETDQTPNKRNKQIKAEAEQCKSHKRKLIPSWETSVSFRRGKPFSSQSDSDRVAVNVDWPLVKQKQAALFSTATPVRISHPPQTLDQKVAPWLHKFETKVNDNLLAAGVEPMMDEVLPDCINAAGFGVALTAREAITEMVEVPSEDLSIFPPEIRQLVESTGMMPDGTPLQMTQVPRVLDSRYVITRISPADFLWPLDFTGSDFNKAPWVGRTGRITWAEAVRRWGLDESRKSEYVGDDRVALDRISKDIDTPQTANEDVVTFDEIFYREHQFDPRAKSFAAIHHLVYVGRKDKPVVDEPWSGQQMDPESGQVIGCLRYPISVLTLTYITDEAIPPSDSAIGRPQVNELNKGRTQITLQREYSIPSRWIDINRIDPAILYSLMRGQWQHVIPVQGSGQNVIGELSRASMPQENMAFDRIIKTDLLEMWQLNSFGPDIETKAESSEAAASMRTRITKERATVGKFYCGIAEVLAGIMCIYEDPATFGEGFTPTISKALSYSILADSTVLLDSGQRLKRLVDFMNFTAKSGWVDVEPVLREIATLSGLDPQVVIKPPKPRPPAEPNISIRLTGTEDLMNPMALALLYESGQGPQLKTIEKAKIAIAAAVTPPGQQEPNPSPTASLPNPADMEGSGEGGPGGMPPAAAPMMPQPPPPAVGQANPNWHAMPRINQRVLDRDANGDE